MSHDTFSIDENRCIRFGIMGAGRIAGKMAQTITAMSKDERWRGKVSLDAVATRDSHERASAFALDYGIKRAYGFYADLLADDDIDCVYIATPHSFHAEQAIACMESGKHVLVEKAFTINSQQAHRVIDVSKRTGLACVEAIWTRFLPSRSIIRNLIDEGYIGDVVSISANLSYPMTHKERLVNPDLAGGALLDVGVYGVNFVAMFADSLAERIISSARLSNRGVDELSHTTIWFDNGIMADITTSFLEVGDRLGIIRGTRGIIRVENINNPESITVYDKAHHIIAQLDIPEQITGFEYEVDAVRQSILSGHIESDDMPHEETLRMMEYCDSIRSQWGMYYPSEIERS